MATSSGRAGKTIGGGSGMLTCTLTPAIAETRAHIASVKINIFNNIFYLIFYNVLLSYMHRASPVLEETPLLLVVINGNFVPVYTPPIGIIVAQPISIQTAPIAKIIKNLFIVPPFNVEDF
jgi:hypothetical protein